MMWILFGGLSAAFTVFTLVCAIRKSRRYLWASVCGWTFTAFTLLSAHAMIREWVEKEDWSALMDVVPTLYGCLIVYVAAMAAANVAAMILYRRESRA